MIALLALGAFAIGSIPFGYVIGMVFFRTDIRRAGSGNIGAMNALRTIGKSGAIAVLFLDTLKGFVPPLLVLHFWPAWHAAAAIVAASAVLGHCISPWLGWRGGKGVATAFGAVFAIAWPAGVAAIIGWLIGAAATRYSSVGSMLGAFFAAGAIYGFTHDLWFTAFGIYAALFILYRHRENIERLLAGRENPIRL